MTSTTIDMNRQREALLRVLAAATFIIFFQAFMVAPIIPQLAATFAVSPHETGFIVPAYLIPYGAATLAYGLLADRIGIWRIMAASLCAFALLTSLTATAQSITQLAFWRLMTGLGASGVVPLALVLIGRLFPYERRGRPLGWLFGAMAGGMAFGSTIGAVLEPYTGWRIIFIGVGIAGAGILAVLLPYRNLIADATQSIQGGWSMLFQAYRGLITSARGQRTYLFVLLNSIFHSGVFTWLGLYFERQYGLGPVGIGLALLGYGVPGFLFGPLIGRAADRFGRGRILPIGLGIGALAAAALLSHTSLLVAALAVTVLSLGYDMTQPLFAGIVTSLGGQRPGQAMGLNVFMLFIGFGLGSLIFGEVLSLFDFGKALILFAVVEAVLCLLAFRLFREETAS
ncbi:MFS transporter [Massilia sp. YIM B02763]|uniref:MFS transporter n=1 Tax=Massilia sp. YIM B02763 TaxID=3050130 RepID=UPI0025B6EBFB|nr:MFS transporter [Massilia sp. YIM B02763]MDN4054245.1 MFS transporter [Massilia sp. YIM B02763]